MKNKVVVTIADRDYTMVAVEDENYVRKCAAHVDQQLREIANSRISQADAAVLAAMNIADQYFREQDAAENLRREGSSGRRACKRGRQAGAGRGRGGIPGRNFCCCRNRPSKMAACTGRYPGGGGFPGRAQKNRKGNLPVFSC